MIQYWSARAEVYCAFPVLVWRGSQQQVMTSSAGGTCDYFFVQSRFLSTVSGRLHWGSVWFLAGERAASDTVDVLSKPNSNPRTLPHCFAHCTFFLQFRAHCRTCCFAHPHIAHCASYFFKIPCILLDCEILIFWYSFPEVRIRKENEIGLHIATLLWKLQIVVYTFRYNAHGWHCFREKNFIRLSQYSDPNKQKTKDSCSLFSCWRMLILFWKFHLSTKLEKQVAPIATFSESKFNQSRHNPTKIE